MSIKDQLQTYLFKIEQEVDLLVEKEQELEILENKLEKKSEFIRQEQNKLYKLATDNKIKESETELKLEELKRMDSVAIKIEEMEKKNNETIKKLKEQETALQKTILKEKEVSNNIKKLEEMKNDLKSEQDIFEKERIAFDTSKAIFKSKETKLKQDRERLQRQIDML